MEIIIKIALVLVVFSGSVLIIFILKYFKNNLLSNQATLTPENKDLNEFFDCIGDLENTEIVQSMNKYIHHGEVTCLDHTMNVSYLSFKICKRFNLDYRSAARGGLLHDFYLYDWHIPGSHTGLHGFNHSAISLENAEKYFTLNKREKDIILKHMWPLTYKLPRYKESFIVLTVDKYCSASEIFQDRFKRLTTKIISKKE